MCVSLNLCSNLCFFRNWALLVFPHFSWNSFFLLCDWSFFVKFDLMCFIMRCWNHRSSFHPAFQHLSPGDNQLIRSIISHQVYGVFSRDVIPHIWLFLSCSVDIRPLALWLCVVPTFLNIYLLLRHKSVFIFAHIPGHNVFTNMWRWSHICKPLSQISTLVRKLIRHRSPFVIAAFSFYFCNVSLVFWSLFSEEEEAV